MIRKLLLWVPFAVITLLFAAFFVNLRAPDDHVVASRIVGKAVPDIIAPPALPGQAGIDPGGLRDGKPRLLNIFASWCVPCRAEAPMLLQLKARGIEIDGVAVHDSVLELNRFLAENGNPYRRLGFDPQGRVQLAFGSSGVPETYVVDARGTILYQHVGVIEPDDAERIIAMLRGVS